MMYDYWLSQAIEKHPQKPTYPITDNYCKPDQLS